MSDSASHIPASRFDQTRTARIEQQEVAAEISVIQEVSEESFLSWVDEGAFALSTARSQTMEERLKRKEQEKATTRAEKAQEESLLGEKIETVASGYSQRNPELQKRSLLFLKSHILPSDSKEEMLKKVLETYPDPALADEALEFLIETSGGELQEKLKKAKEDLNTRFGREVVSGRNIGVQSREFSEKGLGTATALRDLYRAITGHPRDAPTLFNELASRFPYDQMKVVIDFILHALGQDLKSKGPSIDKGELYRLVSEGKSMQAILGIFRFFRSRIPLITQSFERNQLSLPGRLSFEQISKVFMIFLQERYPNPDKVLAMGSPLGLQDNLEGQIILYTQMRDALRQIAPKLFRSEQHRQDVLKSFIEAIERLDEKLEEEEEEET